MFYNFKSRPCFLIDGSDMSRQISACVMGSRKCFATVGWLSNLKLRRMGDDIQVAEIYFDLLLRQE